MKISGIDLAIVRVEQGCAEHSYEQSDDPDGMVSAVYPMAFCDQRKSLGSRYLFTAFDLSESGKSRVLRLRFYRRKKALTPIVCGLCQESDVGDSQPSDLLPSVRSLRQFATHSEAPPLLPWGHRLRGLRVLHLDYCS